MMRTRTARTVPALLGIALLVVGALSLHSAAPPSAAAAQQEITLKLVSFQPVNFAMNTHLTKYVQQVNERGAGKVKIDFLGGPEISGPTDNVRATSKGVFDLVYNTMTYYGGLVPEVISCYLATAPPSKLREIGYAKSLDDIHRKKAGVTLVGFLWGGEMVTYISKKPFDSVQSFKGAKLSSGPLYDGLTKKLGAAPVTVTNPEMYTALQRGVIDAVPLPQGSMPYDTRLYEVAKYIISPPLPYMARAMLLANAKKWDSLPADVRELLTQTMVALEPEVYKFSQSLAEGFTKKLQEKGMTFAEIRKEDYKAYSNMAAEGVWESIMKFAPENVPQLRGMIEKISR